MARIDAKTIKELRERTGVGMQEAHDALSEHGGDIDKAHEALRKKGVAKVAKKSSRAAKDGLIHCYVHGGRVGVLVEVNCETDFVAKTEDFKKFVNEIALQIAAAGPLYIRREDVPEAVLEKERDVLTEQVRAEGKPAAMAEKIVNGKLEKFYAEMCLLDQPSIKDPKRTVLQLLSDAVTKLGENIVIARFTRYQLGD